MNVFGRFLRDKRNQQVLRSLAGALVVVATAFWVAIAYFFPALESPETKASDPISLNVQGDAVAQPAPTIAAPAAPSQGGQAQKTVRVCQEEWRAFKAANQSNGITEKAYVAECRARATAGQSAPTTTAPAGPSQGVAEKTVKMCQEEWRATRAANQRTTTEKAYVAQCRAAATATSPAVTALPASPSGSAVNVPAASPAHPGSPAPTR
jgi:hypothetical protein